MPLITQSFVTLQECYAASETVKYYYTWDRIRSIDAKSSNGACACRAAMCLSLLVHLAPCVQNFGTPEVYGIVLTFLLPKRSTLDDLMPELFRYDLSR